MCQFEKQPKTTVSHTDDAAAQQNHRLNERLLLFVWKVCAGNFRVVSIQSLNYSHTLIPPNTEQEVRRSERVTERVIDLRLFWGSCWTWSFKTCSVWVSSAALTAARKTSGWADEQREKVENSDVPMEQQSEARRRWRGHGDYWRRHTPLPNHSYKWDYNFSPLAAGGDE